MLLNKPKTYIFMAVFLISGCISFQKHQDSENVPVLPKAPWSDPTWFDGIIHATKGSQVVQLGESIHMTQEFPLVRNGALKRLNRENGFDVLAIEGSAVDSWLAMEVLLQNGTGPAQIKEAHRRAFFGIWQTSQMREVMSTVAESFSTDHPLYLTSFDSQVGSGLLWKKMDIWERFADALLQYGLPLKRSEVLKSLMPLKGVWACYDEGFPKTEEDASAALSAIDLIQVWISRVIVQVERKSVVHAKALKLLPYNLRNNIALCKVKKPSAPEHPWRNYQEARDKQNAENVVAILESVSGNHKVVTWAHHSHVHHNFEQKAIPSMGQHLREKLGKSLYTLGTFALSGEALSAEEEPKLTTLQDGPEIELRSVFKSHSMNDFFLDLRNLQTGDVRYESFFRPASVQMENAIRKVVLAKDYDGVIVLQKVLAPELDLKF